MTDAPAYTGSNGKTLGVVALIVSFFFSVLGIILGFVAKSQSKKAGVKNGAATAAIVIGFLAVIVTAIIIGVSVAGVGALASQCAELGSGVHELENGVTVTCG